MPRPADPPRRRARPRALLLVTLCFAGSAALRLADPDGARALLTAEASAQAKEETPPSADCPPGPEELLARLREREAQLDARAERIADRESLLAAAEAKVESQLEALKAQEESLAATIAQADRAAEKDIARLVSLYEAMKPKEAARILQSMEVTFAAGILARMNEKAAGHALAGMSPNAPTRSAW